MPSNQDTQDAPSWLIAEWTAKLLSSIEMMTEQRPGLTVGARTPSTSAEVPHEALWYSIPLDLTADAAFYIGATQDNWLRLGKAALTAAGVEDAGEADSRGTYIEIVSQTTSSVAQSIALRLGTTVASLPGVEIKFEDLAAGVSVVPIDISLGAEATIKMHLTWSGSVEQQLSAARTEEQAESSRPEASAARHPELEKSRTIDVLMEVELPVSVSFGRTDLPLRDVLKLNSGSIVELNRTISDPVEIIVNNCVIARGEVVVVDGNYGVRIQQVVSREERLRTLK